MSNERGNLSKAVMKFCESRLRCGTATSRVAALSRRDDRGDTLVEVLLALVVLALATVALMTAFATSFSASAQHQTLSTVNSALKSLDGQVVSQVQSTQNFLTCAATPSTSNLSLSTPLGYSSSITNVQYWNATTGTWTSTCASNAPQKITVTVTNTSTQQNYTSTFVVNDPVAPPIATSGASYQLAFTTPPAGAAVGSFFTTQPVVSVEDSKGVVVSSDLSQVSLAITGSTVPLNNCVAQETSGVVVYSGCEIDTVGTYTLTATDGSLVSATTTITVTKGVNTITPTSTPPSPAIVASSSYTPTATATSNDAVVITSASSAICTVSSGVVTFIAPGLCGVNFNDAGNVNFAAAATVTQPIYVYFANTITIKSAAPTSAAAKLS